MDINKQRNNSKYRIKLKNKATTEELIFKNFLEKKQIKFIFQKGFLSPFHRIVDFYIKKYRLIIEIDGGYHNNIKYKDNIKDKIWKDKKFKTLRILNEQINNGSFIEIFDNFILNNYL